MVSEFLESAGVENAVALCDSLFAALELDAQLLLGHPLEVLDRAALLGLDLLEECT